MDNWWQSVGCSSGRTVIGPIDSQILTFRSSTLKMNLKLARIFNRLSLKGALIVPFMIQIFGTVGVVGYLSFKNGQMAVNELAEQLRKSIALHIVNQLQNTIDRPHVINAINAKAIQQGDLDIVTGKGVHSLWQQAKLFPSTNFIYCGTEEEGAFLGVGYSEGGQGDRLEIHVANPSTDRYHYTYKADSTGNRSHLIGKGNRQYDPRKRPWYTIAKSQDQPIWSEIYLGFKYALPTITASTPVYDDVSGQLRAICATDIVLSLELNQFLRNLDIGESGIAFIMEPSGFMVATSTSEPIAVGTGENMKLVDARDSQNPLIREAARFLDLNFKGLDNIQSSQLTFSAGGQRQYLEVVRVNDPYGLDWVVVILVPEADFMEKINQNKRITLILCAIALAISVLISLLVAHWLIQPIQKLSCVAKSIARGYWDEPVFFDRQDAIGDLSRSLSDMAKQLRFSFETLENRIEDRTKELAQANQELQRLASIDGLTQTANRRYFNEFIEGEWEYLSLVKKPLTVIFCDVDYFKKYNDTYGHQQGDRCLKEIARVLEQTQKPFGGLVARYGGEEFVIVGSKMTTSTAIGLVDSIKTTLGELKIPHRKSDKKYVTLSVGIATAIPTSDLDLHALVAAADRALYAAKTAGRDRYRVAEGFFID